MSRTLSESLIIEGIKALREQAKGYKTLDDFTYKKYIRGFDKTADMYDSSKNPNFSYANFKNDGFRMAGLDDADGKDWTALYSIDPYEPGDPPGGTNTIYPSGGGELTGSGRSTPRGGMNQARRMNPRRMMQTRRTK